MFGFDIDMVYRIPALLAAMTIHEYSHARAAVAMGDPTPRFLGRLTLNPISHIDPVGLLLLFVAYLFLNQWLRLTTLTLLGFAWLGMGNVQWLLPPSAQSRFGAVSKP